MKQLLRSIFGFSFPSLAFYRIVTISTFVVFLGSCKQSAEVSATITNNWDNGGLQHYDLEIKETGGECGASDIRIKVKTTFTNEETKTKEYLIGSLDAGEKTERYYFIALFGRTTMTSSIANTDFSGGECFDNNIFD